MPRLDTKFNRYFNDHSHLDGSLLVQLREEHTPAFSRGSVCTIHTDKAEKVHGDAEKGQGVAVEAGSDSATATPRADWQRCAY